MQSVVRDATTQPHEVYVSRSKSKKMMKEAPVPNGACIRPDRTLALAAIGFFVIAIVAVFAKVLFSQDVLLAPDVPLADAAFLKANYWSMIGGSWREGSVFPPMNIIPQNLLLAAVSAEGYAMWSYVVDAVLIFLATFCLLRVKSISIGVAAVGALAMAFSSHTFTLISAGHLTKTNMVPYAIISFALFDIAFTKRSIFWFAMAGLAVGLGASEHYDVMYFFGCLAAAYIAMRLVCLWLETKKLTTAGICSGGALLALVVAIGVFLPQMLYVVREVAPSREAAASVTERKKTPEETWEFATNWSLPPEEILEFIIPGIFGLETGSTESPYWGRTGQSKGWPDHHQGLRNLRQHTIYLGVIQMIFAFYGISRFRRWRTPLADDSSSGHAAGQVDRSKNQRVEVIFWTIAWIVCVLLALGRYGPLYSIAYKILPYWKSIRGPIKFLHLIELATVVLFAFGLDRFIDDLRQHKQNAGDREFAATRKAWSRFAVACFCISGIILAAIGGVVVKLPALTSHWTTLGFGDSVSLLHGNLLKSLLGSAILFGCAGTIFVIAKRAAQRSNLRRWLPVFLCLVLFVDLVRVARPFVKTDPLTTFRYSPNVLTDTLLSDDQMYRVAFPVLDGLSQELLARVLPYAGIQTMQSPSMSQPDPHIKRYHSALARMPVRLWQLENACYVFGPRDAFGQLMQSLGFSPVLGVTVVAAVDGMPSIMEAPLDKSPYVLLRNDTALPRALLYHSWRNADDDTAWIQLASTQWNPLGSVLVEDVPSSGPEATEGPATATVIRYELNRIELYVDARTNGILLINDRFDSHWKAQINGQDTPVLKCNAVMGGVKVPPGKANVTLEFQSPYRRYTVVKVLCGLAGLLWGACRGLTVAVRRLRAKG